MRPRPASARARLAAPAVMAVLVGLVVGVAVLTGCSNREAPVNKTAHSGVEVARLVNGVQQAVVHTGSDFRFHPSTVIVHPGRVRIVLVNTEPSTGGPPHNLQVTGLPGIAVPFAYPGGAAQDTFVAPSPGRYAFVCTIHVQQGQTGVLVVERGPAPT